MKIIKCKSGGYILAYNLRDNAVVMTYGQTLEKAILNFVDAYNTMNEYLKIEK